MTMIEYIKMLASFNKNRKSYILIFLNLCLALYPLLITTLFFDDKSNVDLATRDDVEISRNYLDHQTIGFYPMGGMSTMLAACLFDALAVISITIGTGFGLDYEMHYARFNIINVFLTVTGGLLVTLTDSDAKDFTNNYFKVAMFKCYTIVPYENADANNNCRFIDTVQSLQNCCGYESPQTWTRTKDWDPTAKLLPYSCCTQSKTLHGKGCKDLVLPTFNKARTMAKIAALVKIVIIGAAMIFSSIVFREKWSIPNEPQIRRRRYQHHTMVVYKERDSDDSDSFLYDRQI